MSEEPIVKHLGAATRSLIILADEVRTEAPAPVQLRGYKASGIQLVVNVSEVDDEGSPKIKVKLSGVDVLSDSTFDLVESIEMASVGTHVLTVYPGVGEVANVSVSQVLPHVVQIGVTHDNADEIAYSIAAYLLD